MSQINADTILMWVTAGSAFLLVACVWFGAMLLMRLRKTLASEKIEARLEVDGRGRRETPESLQLWRDGQMVPVLAQHHSVKEKYLARLEIMRRTLGWTMSPFAIVLSYCGLIFGAFLIALFLTDNIVFGVMGAMVAGVGPYIYAQRQFDRQNALFERQFSEALGLATRSLRAGQPLMGAFHLIVEEMDPPVSRVFEEICQQQTLGMSLQEAVRTAAENTTSADMKLFAASMSIQMRSGGNVSDMMDRLADVIRDRIRLHRRARVLTAQTQLSKRVLFVIPFIIFLILYVINRHYLAPLYETSIGRAMLLTACVLLVVGGWVMNRISILRY